MPSPRASPGVVTDAAKCRWASLPGFSERPRLFPHHLNQIEQTAANSGSKPAKPGRYAQSRPRYSSPQRDIELMVQKQVLGPKPASLTDRKRTFRRCQSRPDGIFGKDTSIFVTDLAQQFSLSVVGPSHPIGVPRWPEQASANFLILGLSFLSACQQLASSFVKRT